jgi:F0F1-type ATP synthase assembly protein I
MSRETPRPPASPDASKYLGVGLTLAVSTLGFLWLGTLADGWLGTEPLFTLVGAFVGAAAGFYYMIHHLVRVPRRRSEAEGEGERERKERSGRGKR